MRGDLPPSVREGVSAALEERLGRPADITDVRSVGGGCINPSARVEIEGGDAFFLKWNAQHPELFGPEADGLKALSGAEGLRVPEVLGVGAPGDGSEESEDGESGPLDAPNGVGWLLLEFIPEGRPGPGYDEDLALGLAAIHSGAGPGNGSWGWPRDNFIGSLPQSNTNHSTWPRFWIEERIRPQLDLARDRGAMRGSASGWERLYRRADELLAPGEEEGPSLLHGDLWSGNVYPGPRGRPILIDPAVYRGHREVDLAMTELFGGFGTGFYRHYREKWPLAPGYEEVRRHLYQLYPLLVHVNLFGGGYVSRAQNALERALSAA